MMKKIKKLLMKKQKIIKFFRKNPNLTLKELKEKKRRIIKN